MISAAAKEWLGIEQKQNEYYSMEYWSGNSVFPYVDGSRPIIIPLLFLFLLYLMHFFFFLLLFSSFGIFPLFLILLFNHD